MARNELIIKRNCHQAGLTLLESAVTLAVLGVVAVIFLSGLTMVSRANFIADESGTAASLAQLQTEAARATPYVYEAAGYPLAPLPSGKDYLGYSANISVQPLHSPDDGIQKITVDIWRAGKLIYSIGSYKVYR